MPEIRIDPRWAWQEYQPSDASPWDLKKAGHLLRRAGFAGSLEELQTVLRDGPKRTLDRLLADTPDPDDAEIWTVVSRGIVPGNVGDQLPALWLYRMLHSKNPLREKMTLFWHNHFATSNSKVRNAAQMLTQYELMRRHALGSFRLLLEDMSHDPAMMVWLDTVASTRQKPNENYARELLELFSLGIYHLRRPADRNYTEQDIREAARAFTGWRVENNRAAFHNDQHDPSEKTVLGQTGRWQSRDIVRICLDQEACALFICKKLFRWLVSDTLPVTGELLEPLAAGFRRDYDIGKLAARVLRSNLFFSPQAYRGKVKSPVDFALGILHGLEAHRDVGTGRRIGPLELSRELEGLGQKLFYPPSVAGWDAGRAWLNGQTYLQRQNLALAMTSTVDDRFGRRLDPAALARRHRQESDEEVVDLFLNVFLQGDTAPATRSRLLDYLKEARNFKTPVYWSNADAADHRVRSVCHMVLTLPEFQLE